MLTTIEQVIRLILSAGLGGMIGIEREKNHKPAGLRTHILVCVGSTLATIVSAHHYSSDPARIAAAIMTGIGFLGAGAIIASGNKGVHGLTTAATIWAAAAIGIAVGSGAYLLSIITTAIIISVLLSAKVAKTKKN